MKKILLTATVLACMTALTKAQQGRVGINTTTPASTLDVVATTTDNTRPDALLVPRMTAAQLASKDDNTPTAYAADQNGALVYITSGTGTGARKAKITGPGFYYFNSAVPEWTPFGGGSTPVNPALNVTPEQVTNYTVNATDDIVLLNINSPGTVMTLPTGVTVGKRVYVTNRGNNSMDISPLPREGSTVNVPAQQGVIMLYLGGTGAGSWSLISGF